MPKMANHNNARARREHLGLSRERLAADCGISVSTVVRLEQGALPNTRIMTAIAARLDTTIDELLNEQAAS